MIDQDLCSFLKRLFGEDGAIGGDFNNQLLVVGLLVNAEVFYCVLHIFDWRIDRVDGQSLDILDIDLVLIGWLPRRV